MKSRSFAAEDLEIVYENNAYTILNYLHIALCSRRPPGGSTKYGMTLIRSMRNISIDDSLDSFR